MPSPSRLLLFVGIAANVPEVVVRPHDGDVVWEPKPRIVEGQDLFIGDKYLQRFVGAL